MQMQYQKLIVSNLITNKSTHFNTIYGLTQTNGESHTMYCTIALGVKSNEQILAIQSF